MRSNNKWDPVLSTCSPFLALMISPAGMIVSFLSYYTLDTIHHLQDALTGTVRWPLVKRLSYNAMLPLHVFRVFFDCPEPHQICPKKKYLISK